MRTRIRFVLFLGFCAPLLSCGKSDAPRPGTGLHDMIDSFPRPSRTGLVERSTVMDETTFKTIIRSTIAPYQSLAALHQASIALRIPIDAEVSKECAAATDDEAILHCSWNSSFTNADAGRSRQDAVWRIGVGGGLARLPAMSEEGLTLVVCHEIGHLFGGFPFVREGFTGLALPVSVDGQADYFGAQVCLRKIWADTDNTQNRFGFAYKDMIEPDAVADCESTYVQDRERDLCYKTMFAGMSFVKALRQPDDQGPAPSVRTPDLNEVGATDNQHPASQCRLDTFVAGALCPTVFDPAGSRSAVYYDETKIPGYDLVAPGGEEARGQSMAFTCHEGFWPKGARPLCWFSPDQTEEGGWMNDI